MIYSIIKNAEGEAVVIVTVPGEDPKLAPSSHPNFNAIAGACLASEQGEDIDEAEVLAMFDYEETVKRGFERLGMRVTVEGDEVFFDGDPVKSFLTDQLLRFLDAGENVDPLVKFWEKVENNPTPHSREQLYQWLTKHQFTITAEGDIVGYKGVEPDGKGGYQSVRSGPARVNGVAVDGKVPNNVGDVVEMPRSMVNHDPAQGCSVGLHVATFKYAKGWGDRDCTLEVHVDPRDVVSVPTEAGAWEKIRCNRYVVVGPVEREYDGPITPTDSRATTVGIDLTFDIDPPAEDLNEGDRVADADGDEGTVNGAGQVVYDDPAYGTVPVSKTHKRIHGKGGPTSYAAKGNGRNPAQDAAGKFSQGRPGSKRDKGGRFA